MNFKVGMLGNRAGHKCSLFSLPPEGPEGPSLAIPQRLEPELSAPSPYILKSKGNIESY